MAKLENTALIIDFDSTIVTVETLDELAKIVLNGALDRDEKVAAIEEITALGMRGEIDFATSLRQRFEALSPSLSHVEELKNFMTSRLSPSFKANASFWRKNADSIWIVSGGFKEFIAPIVASYGIGSERIFANEFTWDYTGENITGYDGANFLAQADGKLRAVESIGVADDTRIVVVGDGMTDYAIRKAGLADVFIAYIETANRHEVACKADFVAEDFDEVLTILSDRLN